MTEPTPDEAAASLQAVLDILEAGGRHCSCDSYDDNPYEDSDFIGNVSDAQGNNHREVRGAAIRVLLAERNLLRADLAKARADCESWQRIAAGRERGGPRQP